VKKNTRCWSSSGGEEIQLALARVAKHRRLNVRAEIKTGILENGAKFFWKRIVKTRLDKIKEEVQLL
jgi:hypothetical protein